MSPLALFSLHGAADVVVTLATLAVGVVLGAGVAWRLAVRRRRAAPPPGRILVALTGDELPCAAIDAAGRLARAENAVVVPAVLLPTPYALPLDCARAEAGSDALDLLEAVERRLTRAGVQVDGRVVQGRTRRHAVRRLVEQERFDRLVVPAGEAGEGGFSADDVAWLLAHVEGEVLVLRVGSAVDVAGAARSHPVPADPDGARRPRAALPGVGS